MSFQLYNDDCLTIMTQLATESVDLVLTDPPYGISYKSGRQELDRRLCLAGGGEVKVRESYFSEISGDVALPTVWLPKAFKVIKQGGAIYIFCHWSKWATLSDAVTAAGFTIKNLIVLNKSNHGMGDLQGSYAPKHEFLLYATKGRHILRFPNGRDKDVWDVPIKFTGSHREHPNERPISWHLKPLLNSCPDNGIVVDPFMGSGTTGVA